MAVMLTCSAEPIFRWDFGNASLNNLYIEDGAGTLEFAEFYMLENKSGLFFSFLPISLVYETEAIGAGSGPDWMYLVNCTAGKLIRVGSYFSMEILAGCHTVNVMDISRSVFNTGVRFSFMPEVNLGAAGQMHLLGRLASIEAGMVWTTGNAGGGISDGRFYFSLGVNIALFAEAL